MHRFIVTDEIDRSLHRYTTFTGPYPKQLTVGRFQFNSDGTPAGDQAVLDMAAVAEQDYQTLKGIYGIGDIPGQPIIVHVDPTAGGAYHLSCAGTEIWVIPEDAPSLLVAELDECFQALQGKMDCGLAVGEGHSRAMAAVIRPFKVLKGITGDVQGWWNGNPVDYFTNGTASDQNQQSNACNTLGWFWLNSHLGSWSAVTGHAAMSLGQVYTALTSMSGQQGFQSFVAALKAIPQPWPDDPFRSVPPLPLPTPTPERNCFQQIWDWIVAVWYLIFG